MLKILPVEAMSSVLGTAFFLVQPFFPRIFSIKLETVHTHATIRYSESASNHCEPVQAIDPITRDATAAIIPWRTSIASESEKKKRRC
jgi:hypothetical protein